MELSLVSIITPAFNSGTFIADAIESVLMQTYGAWEMIIVDDGSTDDTGAVVKRYNDSRIRYIRLERNTGSANARNVGILHAKGDYLAFLDSDDIWMPQKMERQTAFMQHHGAAMCCTAYRWISEQGQELDRVIFPKTTINRDEAMWGKGTIGNSTVMLDLRKFDFIEVPDIHKREDLALWLKLLKIQPCFYGMQEILTGYRKRKGSLSSNKFSMVKYQWLLFRNTEGLNFIKSSLLIFHWCRIKAFSLIKHTKNSF